MKGLHWFLVLAVEAAAAAQGPIIRAHLVPARNVMVGEPVRLVVTVLVPNYFTGSPDFPEFELENVIVVLPQETPQNSSEHVRGVTYAGITETYTLYPQQPGDFSLPPARIEVHYASAPPKTAVADLTLPSLRLHADIPAAARGLDYFLPTTSLTIQQHWSPASKTLRVGDTVERTITVTAAKMQAMLIPPLPLDAPNGIRVYQEQPSVLDKKSSRNEFLFGMRTQSAKYLIQKEGSYTLPAIELKWWNLSTRRLMTAELPAVPFEVAANPNAEAELPPDQPQQVIAEQHKVSFWMRHKEQFYIGIAGVLAALPLLWFGWHSLPRLVDAAQHWRMQRRESEPAYFRAVVNACDSNHPREAYSALLKWQQRCFAGDSMDEVRAMELDAELKGEIDRLGAILFRSANVSEIWSGQKLAEHLKAWRKQRGEYSGRAALAKLNP